MVIIMIFVISMISLAIVIKKIDFLELEAFWQIFTPLRPWSWSWFMRMIISHCDYHDHIHDYLQKAMYVIDINNARNSFLKSLVINASHT